MSVEVSPWSRENHPAAHLVATKVHAYFARHLEMAGEGPTPVAPLPEVAVIERVIDAAFWASLRREEGYVPKVSLAYLPAELDPQPLLFAEPLPLLPATLAKIAPVVERPGVHLGVWVRDEALVAWGMTYTIPRFCFVLEVVEPGLLVVKHHRGEQAGKYINVAVLEGDQVKIIDESASSLPECPGLLASLLGFDSASSWAGSINVLVQLAVSMRAHRRGGSLLIVPAGSESWRESIVTPIAYAVAPPYRGLAAAMEETGDERHGHAWQQALGASVDAIAGLTAVDGATVMTDSCELLAFGAKIARRRGSPPVEQLTITEPIEGGQAVVVSPGQIGGTRHLSAAQFVHDQRDVIALVASQDGRFTVFAWSPCESRVHAHRVEALLL
ncbi:MAG: hypothetical protein U0Q12_19535 [Vicinamibacterales bacterium]